MTAKKQMGKTKKPSFEEALERLEQIVHELEEGQIGLEESLRRYEEGVKLLRDCFQTLQRAEQRIELLTGVSESGEPITEPFDATATADRASAGGDESASRRSRSNPGGPSTGPPAPGGDEPNRPPPELF